MGSVNSTNNKTVDKLNALTSACVDGRLDDVKKLLCDSKIDVNAQDGVHTCTAYMNTHDHIHTHTYGHIHAHVYLSVITMMRVIMNSYYVTMCVLFSVITVICVCCCC